MFLHLSFSHSASKHISWYYSLKSKAKSLTDIFTVSCLISLHNICQNNFCNTIYTKHIYTMYILWYSTLKDFWSSYRKLAWVRFEPMTTEFRSDALTDWAIRPWVQLTLRANFVQLLQFHLFVQCSHLISAIAFVSRHICFKRNLAQVITLVAE